MEALKGIREFCNPTKWEMWNRLLCSFQYRFPSFIWGSCHLWCTESSNSCRFLSLNPHLNLAEFPFSVPIPVPITVSVQLRLPHQLTACSGSNYHRLVTNKLTNYKQNELKESVLNYYFPFHSSKQKSRSNYNTKLGTKNYVVEILAYRGSKQAFKGWIDFFGSGRFFCYMLFIQDVQCCFSDLNILVNMFLKCVTESHITVSKQYRRLNNFSSLLTVC